MKCNHLTTVKWHPNTGEASDESQEGTPMAIQTPTHTLLCLRLCRDCGTTFGAKPTKRTTAATLRILKGKAKK